MYLFHAISTYQLLEMIIYKTKFHKDDKCVLMITDTLADKFPTYKKLQEFFNDIIVYPIASPPIINSNLPKSCEQFFASVFEKHGLGIEEFKTIYVGCAHYYFGIYLASYQIPFVFFEDAAGIQSRSEILVNIESQKYPIKQKKNLELGLYDGSAKCITKVICNHTSQTEEVKNSTEHFDVVEAFLELDEDVREKIKMFFVSFDNIEIPENSVLFLTQHLANMMVLSFDKHVLLYQMVMDYFFKNETVVFKPHPDDIVYYGILFPESQIIRERFPAEFLPVMFTNKPKTIATVSSTAFFNLEKFFDNSFFLDTRTEKDFESIHRYYMATKLYELIAKDSKLIGIGDNKPVVTELCKANGIEKGEGESDFYIIDDIESEEGYTREKVIELLENMGDNDSAVLVNFKEDYCFYDINHKNIFDCIVPVCISKRKLKDDEFYASTETETIYFYSKNKEHRKMAENADIKQTLEHTGVEISLEQLSPEQKQIKALEGVLKATEKRLLYYINRVKELEGGNK